MKPIFLLLIIAFIAGALFLYIFEQRKQILKWFASSKKSGKPPVPQIMKPRSEEDCPVCRMAREAGLALINVPLDIPVLVIHVSLIVVMTINTTKLSIAGRIGMTFTAIAPCSVMFSRIDGENTIMVSEFCRFPSGICRMAIRAGS